MENRYRDCQQRVIHSESEFLASFKKGQNTTTSISDEDLVVIRPYLCAKFVQSVLIAQSNELIVGWFQAVEFVLLPQSFEKLQALLDEVLQSTGEVAANAAKSTLFEHMHEMFSLTHHPEIHVLFKNVLNGVLQESAAIESLLHRLENSGGKYFLNNPQAFFNQQKVQRRLVSGLREHLLVIMHTLYYSAFPNAVENPLENALSTVVETLEEKLLQSKLNLATGSCQYALRRPLLEEHHLNVYEGQDIECGGRSVAINICKEKDFKLMTQHLQGKRVSTHLLAQEEDLDDADDGAPAEAEIATEQTFAIEHLVESDIAEIARYNQLSKYIKNRKPQAQFRNGSLSPLPTELFNRVFDFLPSFTQHHTNTVNGWFYYNWAVYCLCIDSGERPKRWLRLSRLFDFRLWFRLERLFGPDGKYTHETSLLFSPTNFRMNAWHPPRLNVPEWGHNSLSQLTPSLVGLELEDFRMTSSHWQALSKFTKLQSLKLPWRCGRYESRNKLSLPMSSTIFQRFTELTELDISGRVFQEDAFLGDIEKCRSLGRLTNLTSLDAAGCHLLPVAGFLGKLVKLTTLDISENNASAHPSGTDWAFISSLINLTSLNLRRNRLCVDAIKHLQCLTLLQRLDLSGNELTSETLRPLTSFSSLKSLNLSWNKIDSASLQLFAKESFPHLTSIDFSDNLLTDTTFFLQGKLPSLIELNLNYNRLSSLTSLSGLTVLHTLRRLEISLNAASSEALLPVRSLPSLTFLNASWNKIEDFKDLACTCLRTIDLSHNLLTSTNFLKSFGNSDSLTSIDLSDNQLGAKGSLAGLQKLSSLARLNLSLNGLHPETLPPLLCLASSLTELDLRSNKLDSAISIFSTEDITFSLLHSLDLSFNQLTDLAFFCEGRSVPALTKLDLRNNHLILFGGFPFCSNLQKLEIDTLPTGL